MEPNLVSLSTEQQVSTPLLRLVSVLPLLQLFLTLKYQVLLALFSCELAVSSLFRLFCCSRKVLLFTHLLVLGVPCSLLLLTAIGYCSHATPSIFEALLEKTMDYYFVRRLIC